MFPDICRPHIQCTMVVQTIFSWFCLHTLNNTFLQHHSTIFCYFQELKSIIIVITTGYLSSVIFYKISLFISHLNHSSPYLLKFLHISFFSILPELLINLQTTSWNETRCEASENYEKGYNSSSYSS